jgi:hypothetical protein
MESYQAWYLLFPPFFDIVMDLFVKIGADLGQLCGTGACIEGKITEFGRPGTHLALFVRIALVDE